MRSLRSQRLRTAIAAISRPASSGRGPAPGSPAGASRTIRPSTSTRTRSAIAAAAASWVTMTTVWPSSSTAVRSRPRTSSLECESRLPVGSSAKTTDGSLISARAIATRCCWPPESSAGRWSRRSPIPIAATRRSKQRLVGVAAGELQRQEDVLARVEDRQQVEELKDEADVVAAQLGELAVVEPGEVDAVDHDRARGRAVEAGEDVHQGRLARARRAHDRRQPAGRELDRDAVERGHRGLALAEHAAQVGGADDRLALGLHGGLAQRCSFRSRDGGNPSAPAVGFQSGISPGRPSRVPAGSVRGVRAPTGGRRRFRPHGRGSSSAWPRASARRRGPGR